MPRYLLRRVCYSILVLWGVATLVFLLFNVAPGSFARPIAAQSSDGTSVAITRNAFRQDKSLWTRYRLYLNDLSPIGVTSAGKDPEEPVGMRIIRLNGNNYLSLKTPYLGRSYRTNRSVSGLLGQALPGTIILALTALLIAIVLGISLGMLAALKKNTVWDTGAIAASIAGMSIPAFLAALIIAYMSGYLLSSNIGADFRVNDVLTARRFTGPNVLLPAIALCIRPMAIIIQFTRSAMLNVLSQDYIRTAYAKGLRKAAVIFRHALLNALGPVIAATSGWLAELLACTFFVEYIFGWNGIGKAAVEALSSFDLPVIMGAILLTALIYIIIRLLMDILHSVLDARVRMS